MVAMTMPEDAVGGERAAELEISLVERRRGDHDGFGIGDRETMVSLSIACMRDLAPLDPTFELVSSRRDILV